jgi:hypothetical protein
LSLRHSRMVFMAASIRSFRVSLYTKPAEPVNMRKAPPARAGALRIG